MFTLNQTDVLWTSHRILSLLASISVQDHALWHHGSADHVTGPSVTMSCPPLSLKKIFFIPQIIGSLRPESVSGPTVAEQTKNCLQKYLTFH